MMPLTIGRKISPCNTLSSSQKRIKKELLNVYNAASNLGTRKVFPPGVSGSLECYVETEEFPWYSGDLTMGQILDELQPLYDILIDWPRSQTIEIIENYRALKKEYSPDEFDPEKVGVGAVILNNVGVLKINQQEIQVSPGKEEIKFLWILLFHYGRAVKYIEIARLLDAQFMAPGMTNSEVAGNLYRYKRDLGKYLKKQGFSTENVTFLTSKIVSKPSYGYVLTI